MKPNNRPVAFAYYHDDNLYGFMVDTHCKIGILPKIYYLNDCQFNTIMRNVQHHLDVIHNYIEHDNCVKVNRFKKLHVSKHQKMMMEWGKFEVRVIPCPNYDKDWKYPVLKMHKWLNKMSKPIKVIKFEI